VGLDLHYQQVTVAMQEDGGRIKGAGKMKPIRLLGTGDGKKAGRGMARLRAVRKPEPVATGYIGNWWLLRQEPGGSAHKAMGQEVSGKRTDRRDVGRSWSLAGSLSQRPG